MAAHHYPRAGAEALAALEHAVPGDLVPARLEALCAEHEELDELISALTALRTQGACGVGAGLHSARSAHDVQVQVKLESQSSDASTRTAAIEQDDVLRSGSCEA